MKRIRYSLGGRKTPSFFYRKFFLPLLIILAAALIIFVAGINRSRQSPDAQSSPAINDPLVVVWEYAGIETDYNSIGPMDPVQVVSPTWFHLEDEFGNISSSFDPAYLEWARSRNYQVWALVTNSFEPAITAALLSDSGKRQKFVGRIISLALDYELDGINVDFENFHSDYRDYFTRFISELAESCRQENLILSVDVTMISGAEYWSLGYDRAALSNEADYIMLMAYDEHWQSSPVAGSVASLPWVERGLLQVLEEVPADKLILGIPFYTRLWEIDESGEIPLVLNSWSYSMHRAEEIITDNNAEVYWDNDAGQYVARYSKEGLTYRMWLEDSTSIRQRLALVSKYNLAGIAGWRRGLEKPETWDLIDEYFSE